MILFVLGLHPDEFRSGCQVHLCDGERSQLVQTESGQDQRPVNENPFAANGFEVCNNFVTEFRSLFPLVLATANGAGFLKGPGSGHGEQLGEFRFGQRTTLAAMVKVFIRFGKFVEVVFADAVSFLAPVQESGNRIAVVVPIASAHLLRNRRCKPRFDFFESQVRKGVQVEVTNQASGGNTTPAPATEDKQSLVAECVERVLEILRARRER